MTTNVIISKTFSIPAELYADLETVSQAVGFTPSAVLADLLTRSITPLAVYLRSGQCDYPKSDVSVPLRRYVPSSHDELQRSLLVLSDYCRWSKGGLNETQLDLL